MFIPDPESRIPYPGSKNSNKREEEQNLFSDSFYSHKYHKIKNYLIFEQVTKKRLSQLTKHYKFFTPKKMSLSSQKYGFGIRDPRSGHRKKPFPDPGSRGQKGTGSRIRNTAPYTDEEYLCSLYWQDALRQSTVVSLAASCDPAAVFLPIKRKILSTFKIKLQLKFLYL
jgi:hypothetical protein